MSTEEISYYDEELQELILKIEQGVDGLRKKSPGARSEAVNVLDERMKRAKQVLHSFKVEMRELPREEVALYEAKHKEYHTKLQALIGDIQMAKHNAERQGLGVGSVDQLSTAAILDVAARTQDESLVTVNRIRARVEDTKQVGADTASKLRDQTEQLKNIDADIMKVKSNLNRADVLVRAFIRKMATDKIIMSFMCLIFCGVFGIIIYSMVGGGGGSSDATTTTSGTPVYNNQVYSATGRRLAAPTSLNELFDALKALRVGRVEDRL